MRFRMLLGWMALALVCGSGCETTKSQIKPPMPVDEVRDPPANDPRYTEPPRFPKEAMRQNGPRHEVIEAPGPTGPNTSVGSGGMMRPMGN
jgi:hypothetical protein